MSRPIDLFAPPRRRLTALFLLCVIGVQAANTARAQTGEVLSDRFTLLTRDLGTVPVQLIEISENAIEVRDETGALKRFNRQEVLGLISAGATLRPDDDAGEVWLSDGQRLPGTSLQRSVSDDESLLWLHQRLRQVSIPIEALHTVRFQPGAPLPTPGVADVLRLTNGDRVEGFITGIGDAITLDVNGQETSVPLDRVASMRLVAVSESRPRDVVRLWLTDGTIMDVAGIALSDDGVLRVDRPRMAPEITQQFHDLKDVAGILFNPDLLLPLASLETPSITGPPTRYITPEPMVVDPVAALGLARVRLDGPLTVRWRLPAGTTGFAAEAVLPPEAHRWGHCELIVLDDEREVFRTTLNRTTPRAVIRVPLSGSELSIRIEEGDYGPILDRVILERAALLRESR